jgi:hypothetical protein
MRAAIPRQPAGVMRAVGPARAVSLVQVASVVRRKQLAGLMRAAIPRQPAGVMPAVGPARAVSLVQVASPRRPVRAEQSPPAHLRQR